MSEPISLVIIGGKLRGPQGVYPFGAWVAGTYQKHSVVSHNNAVWLSLKVTAVEPSDAATADWAKWMDGNAGINALNALKTAIGMVTGAVTHMQMRKALANRGVLDDVLLNAINADGTDTASVHWNSAYPIVQGNVLSNAIRTALGYSDAQMTTLFAEAAAILYNTP